MGQKEKIKTEIGTLEHNSWSAYFTDGSWSLHQLLEYVLEQTGPAEIHLSAFSLSENAVRSFVNLKESGKITKLHCLLNNQMARFKTDLMFFLMNVSDTVKLAPCHAKVIVIENEKWKVMIIGSANFNRNIRYESGVICTIGARVQEIKTRLLFAMKHAAAFIYD